MAKAMSPVFTKLMNMVLALRPENVEQYIIGCLNDMKLSGDYDIVEEVLNVEAVPTAPEVVEGEQVVTEETAATETVGSTEGDDVAMPAKMTILTLGLSLSGKTTMLKAIQGDPNPTPKPTVGFVPHALQLGSSVVTFYDLGGGDSCGIELGLKDWSSVQSNGGKSMTACSACSCSWKLLALKQAILSASYSAIHASKFFHLFWEEPGVPVAGAGASVVAGPANRSAMAF